MNFHEKCIQFALITSRVVMDPVGDQAKHCCAVSHNLSRKALMNKALNVLYNAI